MNTRKKQIILRGATLLSILILTCPVSVMSQSKAPKLPASTPVKTPEVVVEFLKVSGPEPESEVFYARAKEALWSVYPHDETLKRELVAYVQSATDGPGLGFAGLALIPFHDPTTVKPLMNRALDRRTSPATRSCFLNAAPYVLSMGDAFFQGQGALDREAQDFAREILKLAGAASLNGLGRSHAARLREMFEASKKDAAKDSDLGLAVWHQSAYLVGTLDPGDRDTLAPLFDPDYPNVLGNLMQALSFAANRNFLAELQAAEPSEITRDLENKTIARALDWWKGYARQHAGGDWLPAILAGFRETGYDLEDNLQSEKSIRAIVRAMDSKSEVTRYNAYRLLNHAFKTHFDLERIFLADKYALSFLEPMAEKEHSEERLKRYWKDRLKG